MTPSAIRQILVIDDELSFPTESVAFRDAYPVEGFEFLFAESEESARTILDQRGDIALILLDIRFEGRGDRHGLQILKDLVGSGCKVPIVMLSSINDPSVIEMSKDFGALDYIKKWDCNPKSFYQDLVYEVTNHSLLPERLGPAFRRSGFGGNKATAATGQMDRYIPMEHGRYKPDFANGLAGWIFTPEEIRQASASGRMLTLDIDSGAMERCELRCQYCYRTADDRDTHPPNENLSMKHLCGLVEEAADLGATSIKVVGAGEPFADQARNILELSEEMAKHGIRPVIFTNGWCLADEDRAQHYFHMSSRRLAEEFFALGTAFVLKLNSRCPKVQDAIVQRAGYSVGRDKALRLLIDLGFNVTNPTRLGMDTVILKDTYEETFQNYVWLKEQNIYPVLNTYIPCGLASRRENIARFDVTPDQKLQLFEKILRYNAEHGIPVTGVSSYAGGQICSQLGYGMYVTIQGDVFPCPAHHFHLGNVSSESLAAIWRNNSVRRTFEGSLDNGCPPRREDHSLPTDFFNAVKGRISDVVDK